MSDKLTINSDRCGIISACTWALDRIKIIDQWPQEEHLAQITKTDRQGGGCGYNLGVDIRKLDGSVPVEAIGLIGDDADGEFLLQQATAAGIDTTHLQTIADDQTSYTDVYIVAGTGRRTFFHYTGTSDYITPEHFDFTRCKGRILHLGLLGVHRRMDKPWQAEPSGWACVLKDARRHELFTNLELVSIEAERIVEIAGPCVPLTDSLIANEYELSALTGAELCKTPGLIDKNLFTAAAQTLFKQSRSANGHLQLVVAHCPDAAYAMTHDGTVYSKPNFKLNPDLIVSTVGAGDAFAAGMLYGIHQGWELDRALELAHAAAAASLRSATTVESVESVQQCLDFAKGA